MRIPTLLDALARQFTSIDASEADELKRLAMNDYDKILDTAKAKLKSNELRSTAIAVNAQNPVENFTPVPLQVLTKKEEAIIKGEKWEFRYLVAAVEVAVVPMLRNWMNGGDDMPEEEAEVAEMAKFYSRFKAMKQM